MRWGSGRDSSPVVMWHQTDSLPPMRLKPQKGHLSPRQWMVGDRNPRNPVGKDRYSEWSWDTFALCLALCSVVIIKWTLAMRIWASEHIDMRVPGPLAATPMERCSNPMHHKDSLGPHHHVYTALFLLFTSQKTCEKPDTLSLLTFLILLRHFV